METAWAATLASSTATGARASPGHQHAPPRPAGEERALRLTDGGDGGATSEGRGVLEIFHAGAWGTFCKGAGAFGTYDYGPPLTEVCLSELACSSSAPISHSMHHIFKIVLVYVRSHRVSMPR